MKTTIRAVAAAVTLSAASASHAQQAVQWKVSDGGNGHWYQFVRVAGTINWPSARNAALAANGDLAVVDSPQLTAFLDVYYPAATNACFIGCQRTADTWRWVNGQPVSWTNWCSCGQPSGDGPAVEIWSGGVWNDVSTAEARQGYLVEWSSDCNNDGIVDYGQILDGTLGDVDDDGIPDVCDDPCPADLTDNGLVNGADLGLVLAAWGTNGADQAGSDINADGIVNGADLGLLLAGWGPCSTPAWATVISWMPDSSIVTDPQLRASIAATGQPWRVRDTATGIEMLLVPPGTFQMGCSPSVAHACAQSEFPAHQVTLTRAYYLGRYEVTQAQWMATMGSNPSQWLGADLPVNRVEREIIGVFLKATGMRLPTEAEWEWAYRAGTTTAFHGFEGQLGGTNDDTLLPSIAWYSANSGGQTRPVGGKPGNGFGLHDMSGNVSEWVQAWFADYPSTPQVNPTGPIFQPPQGCVVIRGGSWADDAFPARASARSACGVGIGALGFRVARNP